MMTVQTEKFSGPLGLLLSLIEGEEMDITEINLAKIADEYVSYVRQAEGIDPEEMADFLLVAAKLLFIKSKALLPYLYAGEEEEAADDLEKQLRMYKEFVEASRRVKDLALARRFLYLPPLKSRRGQFDLPMFSPPARLETSAMKEALEAVLARLAREEEKKLPERVLEPKINIEEKIGLIRRLLGEGLKLSFSRLLESAGTRTEVIVSFLALLELAKQRELVFEQTELFSEISISKSIREI
mgnify:CR=1 FL=1